MRRRSRRLSWISSAAAVLGYAGFRWPFWTGGAVILVIVVLSVLACVLVTDADADARNVERDARRST